MVIRARSKSGHIDMFYVSKTIRSTGARFLTGIRKLHLQFIKDNPDPKRYLDDFLEVNISHDDDRQREWLKSVMHMTGRPVMYEGYQYIVSGFNTVCKKVILFDKDSMMETEAHPEDIIQLGKDYK